MKANIHEVRMERTRLQPESEEFMWKHESKVLNKFEERKIVFSHFAHR